MTICGVVPARKGEIRFLGRSITGMDPARIVSLGILQVPEGRRIFPHLTIRENLDLSDHLVELGVHHEVVETLAAERGLHCLSDVAGRDAECTRAVAVDLHPHFGFVEFQIDVDDLELRPFLCFLQKAGNRLLQLIEIRGKQDKLDR